LKHEVVRSIQFLKEPGGVAMTMKFRVKAELENVDIVTDFVNEQLEGMDCSMRSVIQIDIALDELFSNVCHYAYGDGVGYATIYVDEHEDNGTVSITLEDEGIPFDPLEHEDPDVTLSIDEREIGGLGIFMVKRTMDDVLYEYRDGKNRITIVKSL
jgi:anti-sigma regulatory factor (Ser/Thr protein kinase)